MKPSIQALVRADLEYRERVGQERYGTSLHPFNGRSALLDAYEEALDLCCYLRQLIEEITRGGGIPTSHGYETDEDRPEFRAARQRAEDETVPEYSR